MTRDHLFDTLAALADRVVGDGRWDDEADDLGVAVFGMLLYGYALATGRLLLFLDVEDVDAAVTRCLVERVGVAAKWAGGLVEDANRSSFDRDYHPGQHDLIGVGHQYFVEPDPGKLVDNVFANLAAVRRRAESSGA